LRVNLTDLDREGRLEFHRDVPADDPLWQGTDLTLKTGVEVRLDVRATPTGQVLARGILRTTMDRPCRRCLEPVDPEVEEWLELVWSVPDALDSSDEDDGEIRTLDLGSGELDLGPVLREELILAAPAWVVCREDCRGLCPVCGGNLNETECGCSLQEPDPRWDALRDLRNE